MKISKFNIAQHYKESILLYNTYSTSLVELTHKMYSDIFEKMLFDSYPETNTLLEMGFIVSDDTDEIEEMEKLRQCVINNNSDKIANIIIAPTLECNAHCYYCFEKGHRNGIMNTDTAVRLVQYLIEHWNNDKLGITWFGGEPLMASNIIDLVSKELSDNNINFVAKITTNGSLLNKEVITKATSYWNVDKIQITIDAIGEAYNKIKNYDSTLNNPFETVMLNIQAALNANLKIKIRINFDPEKQDIALDTMKYLTDRFDGSDNLKIYFAPIDEDEHIVKNITNNFSDMKEHPYISLIKFGRKNGLYRGFPDMEDKNDLYGELDELGLLKKLKIYPSTTNCYATCPSVYSIDPYGKIYKCHRVLGQDIFSSGNIFSGIEENAIYKFFCNTDMTYPECNDCSILPICQGGCKINAKIYGGKSACAPSKAIINELVLLYKEDMDKLNNH